MNALLVFNFNDFLHPEVRASMRAACERWRCEFVEITYQLKLRSGQKVHPWWQKTLIFEGPAVPYERVAVMDGDMLIRSDCPSFFDLVPADCIGAVSRVQPRYPRREPDRDLAVWASRLSLVTPPKEGHLNGGLVIYSPGLHADVLRAWQNAGRQSKWSTGHNADQAALSVVLYNSTVRTHWLPWNYNVVYAGNQPRRMNAYVYHFNAMRAAKRTVCYEECQWRVS